MVSVSRHNWDLDFTDARKIQEELAVQVHRTPLPETIRNVAGFDLAYDKQRDLLIAGMVVLKFPSLEVTDQIILKDQINFPYVPGYLSFREAPTLLKIIERHRHPVDVYMFDGHGIAHPRGLGIASHIGVLIGRPSIGCAKKRLVGEHEMPGEQKGAACDLYYQGRLIGRVVRTRDRVKPVFVSVGNRITLDEAVRIVISCTTRYRLPEPTRLAHRLVTEHKNTIS